MFKIKFSLMLAVAACAFAAIATPALAAKEFQAKNSPTELKDINIGIHAFETGGGAKVECATAESTARANQMKASTIKVDVKYSKCHVKVVFEFEAEVSQAKYLFQAKGKTSVENTIVIKVPVGGCEITVTPAGNKELGTVTYTNVAGPPKEVEVKAAVTGITQEVKGNETNCGKSNNEGKYKGTSIEKAVTGDIEVL